MGILQRDMNRVGFFDFRRKDISFSGEIRMNDLII
jgi:hypothetical protein